MCLCDILLVSVFVLANKNIKIWIKFGILDLNQLPNLIIKILIEK